MPYILAVEAESTESTNMDTIVVTNGTAKKTLPVSISGKRAFVLWPTVGLYEIDLSSGDVLSEMLALDGIYSIDCETGRLEGTRYVLSVHDLQRLSNLQPGAKVRLCHDCGHDVHAEVEVVDALPSEGVLRVYATTQLATERQWNVGRRYKTGWRVEPPLLGDLRKVAGVVARAS